ncbi:MAG: hypothetical protein ACRDZW_07200 [Acidimicrobiales bacterium]
MFRPKFVTAATMLVATLFVLLLMLAAMPTHVTLGAGSLRCGTALAPDDGSELADVCPGARGHHLRAAVAAAAALAVIAASPLFAPVVSRRDPGRPALVATVVLWVIAAAIALAILGWFVEYSPPGDVFKL